MNAAAKTPNLAAPIVARPTYRHRKCAHLATNTTGSCLKSEINVRESNMNANWTQLSLAISDKRDNNVRALFLAAANSYAHANAPAERIAAGHCRRGGRIRPASRVQVTILAKNKANMDMNININSTGEQINQAQVYGQHVIWPRPCPRSVVSGQQSAFSEARGARTRTLAAISGFRSRCWPLAR